MFEQERDGGSSLGVLGLAVAVALMAAMLACTLVAALAILTVNDAAPTPSSEPTMEPVMAHGAPPPPATDFVWTLISNRFDSPVYVTHAGDGSARLFGVEQGGLIWVIEADGELPEPFIDLTAQMPPKVFRGEYTEQGLLGLAFHPDFERNGRVFVSYTNPAGDSVLGRYQVSADNPNQVDRTSETVLMTVDQPFEDHNGGHIAFGPDGLLYWGLGDGGNVNEPNTRSQDPSLLLGKLIRLDVDGGAYTAPADNLYATEPEFMPEIWALGLRNPWRFSFDRATGDLYIGDVGQWEWEEINFLPAGSPAGANFGWSVYEGFEEYALVTYELAESAVTMPFVTYDHLTGCSVTGGYTYRGQALPELNGYYFYADYCFGRIWTAWRDDSRVWQTSLWMETGRQITSFGEDERGELYLVDYKGEILRLDRGT